MESPSAAHDARRQQRTSAITAGPDAAAAWSRQRFANEAELCSAFTAWAARSGFAVYPETAGFDLLLVDRDGRQTGVQAKLRLNFKVLEQALRYANSSYAGPGPDFRAVLVPALNDGSSLLAPLGLFAYWPAYEHAGGWEFNSSADSLYPSYKFDWNPVARCELPDYVPDVPAGVPSPQTLSPWKVGALRVIAHLRRDGFITRKGIAHQGCDPTRWCQAWLDRGDRQGTWVLSPRCPDFAAQHPDVYAKVVAELGPGANA